MKTRGQNSGFTLIETVVVVAIIAVLVSIVFGVATRVQEQGKIRLCKDTLAIIDTALEQFRDFGYEYNHNDYKDKGLAFPLDCNNLSITNPNPYLNLQDVLLHAIYPPIPLVLVSISGAYDSKFAGSAALYLILSHIPDCRATLEKIDKSLLTNNGTDGHPMDVSIINQSTGAVIAKYPFTVIVDPWKTPIQYDYYPDFANYAGVWTNYLDYRNSAKRTFPVITSAGPDKKFGTKDDITNRQ